jgi:hypothetical protein
MIVKARLSPAWPIRIIAMQTFTCQPCTGTAPAANIPGPQGPQGPAGSNGTDGVNAFTITTSPTVIPAALANVNVNVADSDWMAIGQVLFLSDGPDIGHFQVVTINSPTSVTLKFLNYTGNSAVGATIAVNATVTPSGPQGPAGGGGGGSSAQIIYYTGASPSGPPPNPALPAIALKQDGTGQQFVWNLSTLVWN